MAITIELRCILCQLCLWCICQTYCEGILHRYQEQRQGKEAYTYFFKLLLSHITLRTTHPKILPTLGATAFLYTQYSIINTPSPENIKATLTGTFHPKTQRTFGAFWYSMSTPRQSLPKLKTLPSLGNVLRRHAQPGVPYKINKSPEVLASQFRQVIRFCITSENSFGCKTECLQMLVVHVI